MSWSMQTNILFGSQELWELIVDGFTELTPEVEVVYTVDEKAPKEQRKKNIKARFLLYQGLDESTFERIAEVKTSKEAWESLSTIYKGVEWVKQIRLQNLRGDLEVVHMKDDENISNYYSWLIIITNNLRWNWEKMENVRLMEKLLLSLTPKFEYVVAAIEESKNLKISIEELLGSLQIHKQHMQKKNIFIVLKHAFESKLTLSDWCSHSRGCGHGRGRGYGPNNEPLKIKWRSKASEVEDETIGKDSHLGVETIRNIQCYNCENLNTVSQIVGTELKILLISPKQQMM